MILELLFLTLLVFLVGSVIYVIGLIVYSIIVDEITKYARRKALRVAYNVMKAKGIETSEENNALVNAIVNKIIDENEKNVFDYGTGEPGKL